LKVVSCTEKKGNDGNPYFEIVGSVDGVDGTYYGKEMWTPGDHKALRYGEKKSVYKVKEGGGGGRGPAAPRDYTYEGRMRAVDAVIAHLQGKGDLHTICTAAAAIQEFYKNGTIPPAK